METLFLGFVMSMATFYGIRLLWVFFQCKRAIGYANYLSVKHIMDCAEAFTRVNESDIFDEQKDELRKGIKKALAHSNDYWSEYHKDFDFNKLWFSCDKWSLRQMFPNLTKKRGLVITYE